MDFLKLIRSLEELLFEAMAWLVYYPRTMWRIVRHPLQMMDYAEHGRQIAAEEPYADALSPPLLLLLTILLSHALALGMETALHYDEAAVTTRIFGSHQNLVLARSLAFAVLPLVAAVAFLRRSGQTLERNNLRPPFFGQCYLAAPYALAVSMGVLAIDGSGRPLAVCGGALTAVATLLYLAAQAAQYRRCLNASVARATGLSVLVYVEALVVVLGIAIVAIGIRGT